MLGQVFPWTIWYMCTPLQSSVLLQPNFCGDTDFSIYKYVGYHLKITFTVEIMDSYWLAIPQLPRFCYLKMRIVTSIRKNRSAWRFCPRENTSCDDDVSILNGKSPLRQLFGMLPSERGTHFPQIRPTWLRVRVASVSGHNSVLGASHPCPHLRLTKTGMFSKFWLSVISWEKVSWNFVV